jgi:hypothetical protein
VLLEENLALVKEDGGVDCGLAGAGRCGEGDADEDGSFKMRAGFAELFEDLLAAGEEAGLFEQVGGPVAAERELGEDGETGALGGGSFAGGEDFLEVAGEVADGGVDLG